MDLLTIIEKETKKILDEKLDEKLGKLKKIILDEKLDKLKKRIAEEKNLREELDEEDEEYDEYHVYSYHSCSDQSKISLPLIEERYEEDMNKSVNLREDEDEVKSRDENLTYSPVSRKVLKK
jgi:hypothetical protein